MAEAGVDQPGDQETVSLTSRNPCSEAAQAALQNECEEQFAQLEKLQNEIILCRTEMCDDPQDQSVDRLIETEAELMQWLTMEPKLLSTNPEILLHTAKEEMLKLCSKLEMIAACCQARRDSLVEAQKREEKWLADRKEVLIAATNHVERIQTEREELSKLSILQDTKNKIEKMKHYQECLIEALQDVLGDHFPLPQYETNPNKKKKNTALNLTEDLLSINEILELLMSKILETPHDPYVTIDAKFWPPYVEMLLRHGIAVRHPENNSKIRLETFC